MKKSDIIKLNQYLKEFKKHAQKGSDGWKDFLAVEVDLRKTLIKIAGNPIYETVLTPIHENILAYGYLLSGKDADVAHAYTDWCEIIEALEKDNTEKAGSIIKQHIAFYAQKIKKVKL